MHNKCQIFSEKMKTERGDAGSSVGVCVTGEARAFALHGVRASLRSFLAALGRHTLVRMIVARASSASCSGHIFHASGKMCYLARHSVFRMEHQQLQAEFPGAHITLLNASSCALEPASAQPCCRLHLAEASYGLNLTTPRPEPGAFLQYWTVARCAAELLAMAERQGRSLRFIVRTRPDNVYLRPSETASLIYSARDAARTRVACKFSTCKAATDIFMVTPVQRARAFFGAIPSLMNANCAPALAGAATGAATAAAPPPMGSASPSPQSPSTPSLASSPASASSANALAGLYVARSRAPETLLEPRRVGDFRLVPFEVINLNVLGQPYGCSSQRNQTACRALASQIARAQPSTPPDASQRDSATRIAEEWAGDPLGVNHRLIFLHKHSWRSIIKLASESEGQGGMRLRGEAASSRPS